MAISGLRKLRFLGRPAGVLAQHELELICLPSVEMASNIVIWHELFCLSNIPMSYEQFAHFCMVSNNDNNL